MLVTALTRKRLSRHASARPDEDNLASDMFKVTEEMARTKLQEAAPAFSVKKLLQEAPLLPPCESEVAVNMGFWMNLEEACASSWRSSAMAPQTISAMIGIFWLAAPDPWLMSLVIQDPLELVGQWHDILRGNLTQGRVLPPMEWTQLLFGQIMPSWRTFV